MNHRRAALYLQIPAAYCRSFGGLRWAQYGEAVEFLDGPDAGRTFAFAAEIARFLEGLLTAGESFLAFGSVLHLLYLIGLGDRAKGQGSIHRAERIVEPFRALGNPLRNAGALCAWLCREVPGVADPPGLAEVLGLLNGGSWIPQMVLSHPMLGAMDYAEQPGLEPAAFEARMVGEIDGLSDEAIRHWLKHGRGPVGTVADRLAPLRPRGLAGVLAEVERWPRLAGVTRLVSRLEAALSLPPRRLASSELQTGGYTDVTTRGAPEQILPIQFALDDQEFLRRFAEHELLYFHRELPCQPVAEELVLLLDQGVRTWGDVRLVLAGAAMALARQAERRQMTIKLATTGNDGEPVVPSELEPRALAALLEASDLSPHPGRVLASLLQTLAAAHRDVVLLTHPRSLGEPDVAAAARLLAGDSTRLFAVSVDSGGQVELAELRRGLPVMLGRSRIDLGEMPSPAAHAASTPSGARPSPWRGTVEPIPFPFHCGILDRGDFLRDEDRRQVDFDQTGGRILVVGLHGLLFTWRIDETEGETLPRPQVDGEVMKPLGSVIGVAGGFVLVGNRQGYPTLAHYDFPTRTCSIHTVDRMESLVSWFYYADLHAIAGHPAQEGGLCVAVDLVETGAAAMKTSRAARAAERARTRILPYPLPAAQLWTSPSDPWVDLSCRAVRLDSKTGALEYRQGWGELKSLTPLSDGRPALKGGRIVCVRHGGDVLAVLVERTAALGVCFISNSRAAVIGIFPLAGPIPASALALSRDGRRFARRLHDRQFEVRDVPGDRPPVFVTPEEEVWIHFGSLGRSCLLVREFDLSGPRRPLSFCLIRWDQGRIEVVHDDAVILFQRLGGVVAESRSLPSGRTGLGYDPLRFVQCVEHGGLRILIDRYNHFAVLGRNEELLCMFYVSGTEVAGWLPDGTYLGSRRLIGGEPTAGAAERIAAVLRMAEQGKGAYP